VVPKRRQEGQRFGELGLRGRHKGWKPGQSPKLHSLRLVESCALPG
jgi:hypothetical protein